MEHLACWLFLIGFGTIWAQDSLIIDTDAGGDDAMAIIIALNNIKGYPVKGITTVRGNTEVDQVTLNVLKVLDVSGFLGGSASALVRNKEFDNAFGDDGLGDFDYGKTINATEYVMNISAAEFLANAVKETPETITILCLGPLTNIALASRLNPNFFTQVKQILISGGSMTGIGNSGEDGDVEFNMYMDPEAAIAVFSQVPDEKPVVLATIDVIQNYPIPMSFRVGTLGSLGGNITNFLNHAEFKALTGNEWLFSDQLLPVIINDSDVAPGLVVGTPSIESSGRMVMGPGNNVIFISTLTPARVEKNLLEDLTLAINNEEDE